jgi:alpha-1,6-mannosyltransferase
MWMPPTPARPRSPHLLDACMFWGASPTGGVRRVIGAKRAHLRALGWRHTLLAPGARGRGEVDCGGVPLPGSGGYRFVVSRTWSAHLMRTLEPDIIEAADPYRLGWSVLDAARCLGVPSVAFCHSDLPRLVRDWTGGPHSALAGWCERRAADYLVHLYSSYDLVLAPSRAMTRTLQQLGVRQALHQPLGVDTAVFSPAARNLRWRARLAVKLELHPATRLMVYSGRFAPEKHLDLLAEAVRRLGRGHALIAVGAGPRPPQGDHVRVIGPQQDPRRLARLLANADLFVHAGDQETFGLAALEAMACGTPVLVRDAAGLGELARGAGLTIARNEPAVWADAMADALGECREGGLSAAQGALGWLAGQALERARSLDWSKTMALQVRRYRQAMRRPPEKPLRGALASLTR